MNVELHQDLGPSEYRQLLAQADVGLSLRIPGTELATTTFPSKVVEFASHGLLVLSTDVSDIRLLFDERNAALLPEATPHALADRIASILRSPDSHRRMAELGQRTIASSCGRREVGARLISFLGVAGNPQHPGEVARSSEQLSHPRFEIEQDSAPPAPATMELDS